MLSQATSTPLTDRRTRGDLSAFARVGASVELRIVCRPFLLAACWPRKIFQVVHNCAYVWESFNHI